jgi:hypothetical protein
VTAYTERRRGSRVSSRRRRHRAARHPGTSQTATRHAATLTAAEDRRPFWIYVRDPDRGLMITDGLNYIGERCAQRQAAKLERYYGQPTRVRLSPRA